MSLDREEPSVSISQRRLSELETKANAANDFIQHFQNIDKELKKEKAKVKKFTKMLIDDQKVIGRLTSARCISATDPSSIDPRSLYYIQQSGTQQSIIEIDGSSGSSFTFQIPSNIPILPSSSASLADRSRSTKASSNQQNNLTVEQNTSLDNLTHLSDPSQTNGSLQYKRSASMNISINSSKENRNVFAEVIDNRGVSEMVFLNLVKELKRTKQCLSELMLQKGTSIEEFMRTKVDRATLEDMAANIEDLKKENENYQNKISELNNSLCFYKNIVKTEKEGLTMQFDSKRQKGSSQDTSLDLQKSLEETDKLKVENCQLKEQLLKLEEDKNVILDNYAKCIQTVSELENHLNEDQLKKKNDLLKKETEMLQRELKNLQNDNEKLVSSVSHSTKFTEMLKLEKSKCAKMEAELKEGKMKQENMDKEILLLKAKVKHLLKQVDAGKTKPQRPQDKLQAPVKPTKITKASPVESSSSFIESELIASSSVTGVKVKTVEHMKKLSAFECERCQAQFEDEMEHLCHINKCLD